MKGLEIAKLYVPKHELVKVAQAVLKAQNMKENSWDNKTRKYNLESKDAAKKAVKYYKLEEHWVEIIHLWNTYDWNDAQDWANKCIVELTIKLEN